MTGARLLCLCALLCGANLLSAQSGGVSSQWDTQTLLTRLSGQAQRLEPLLNKVNPNDWISRGAPDAYVGQWKTATTEAGYLVRSSQVLARQPEKLTAALDTLFRLQNLEVVIGSLAGGIRRYQDTSLADQLQQMVAENANNRDKLREYVLDLAKLKEQEYQTVNREAQTCRATLSRQPVTQERSKSKR